MSMPFAKHAILFVSAPRRVAAEVVVVVVVVETGGGAGGGRKGSSETPSPDHIEEDFPGYQPRARDGRSFAPDGGLFHVLRAL